MKATEGVQDVTQHELTDEVRESLIDQAKADAEENRRVEAARFNDDIMARLAILSSLGPKERDRVLQHLKEPPGILTTTSQPAAYPLPPGYANYYYYQVMRPPFTPASVSPPYSLGCYDFEKHQTSSLHHVSSACVPEQGALSLHAAVGLFNGVECIQAKPWVIGDAISIGAFMGFDRQLNMKGLYLSKLLVEVDYVIEEPARPWACLMIPGDPGSGLGLVGALGIANMTLAARVYPPSPSAAVRQSTYERFLLGSASAHHPGELDLEKAFTLSASLVIPSLGDLDWFHIYLDAQLTAFWSVPANFNAPNYPGFVQSNLTLPYSGGVFGPSAPLKVKEIRASIFKI